MYTILEWVRGEWSVLKSAPFSFVGSLLVGLALASWYYHGQIVAVKEQLNTKDGQIGRYRVALGIDPASQGALIELNNRELQAKAFATVIRLRDMCSSLQKKSEAIQVQLHRGMIDEKARYERIDAMNKELSNDFMRNLRADAFNVDNELRRRLGPQAVAAIIGITPSVVADDGTRVDILTLVMRGVDAPGFSVGFVCTLADGVEQMAKLLQPNSN